MWGEWLISSSTVEEGTQLSHHGVYCARSKPDRAVAVLTTRLPQKGTTTHMDLSAPATVSEEEKFAHILGGSAVRRRSLFENLDSRHQRSRRPHPLYGLFEHSRNRDHFVLE